MISLLLGETSEEHRLRIHHTVFHIEFNASSRYPVGRETARDGRASGKLGFRRTFETGVDVHGV
jgi:hypothetical protein